MATTVEILQDTRRILTVRGWAQGSDPEWITGGYYTTDGRTCLYGALREAHGHHLNDGAAYTALSKVVARRSPEWGGSLVDFNDAKGRTEAEVLAVVDDAIAAVASA